MTRTTRILLGFAPFFTLILGWQLGYGIANQQFGRFNENLESLYLNGGTESGQILKDPEKEVDLAVLWAVWKTLQRTYIAPEELEPQKLLLGAAEGLVRSVGDPYTVFMTPKQSTDFHQALEGKLQGIGAELAFRDGLVVIVAPLKGSPAQRAGLLPEDIIAEIDGEPTDGWSLDRVVQRVRGPKGTTVKIAVAREGEADLLHFVIVRAEITIPSVESKVVTATGAKIGVIALNQFGDESIAEVRQALDGFQKEKLRGIVLDLRFNGGGYLEGATDLTSFFLKQGKVVIVERRGGNNESHYVSGRPLYPEIPLVVLINAGSASASEIVAGALQDSKRATIIGQKSFGKGTVQEVIELPGGSSLRVTVARWVTPNGRDIGKEGIMPDIVVERTPEQMKAEVDPQLERALQVLFQ